MKTLLASLLLVAGCSCWQPEHRNDIGCVVLHQLIDCTTDAATATLVPSVVAIVEGLISGNTAVDWSMVEQRLELAGIRDGGCILAALEADFIAKKTTRIGAMVDAASIHAMRERFAVKFKLQGVRYKLANGQVL